MHDYDVIVAGGGPAGLSTAARTAAAGLSTLVVERNPAIGIPLRTSGASWIDELDALGVPARFHVPMRRIRVVGPSVEATFDYRAPRMCVLDVRAFYQWLAACALDAGAALRLGTRVEATLDAGGRAAGVTVRTPGGRHAALSARVVVDATGYPSVLARKCGLHDGFAAFGVGAELDLYAPRHDPHEAILIVGRDFAPHGYAWAFPCGDGRVRLGVGIGRPHGDANPAAFLAELRARLPALAQLVGASAIESHTGVVPLCAPRAVPLARAGLVVAGDAAGQASALVGEGIRFAVQAGRLAGDAIAAACAGGGFSDGALAGYDAAWRRRERNLRFAFEIYRKIVTFDDADWDREVAQLGRLTPEQFAQGLMGDFTLRWLIAVAPRYTGMLVPGRFRNGVRRFGRGLAPSA
jgi:digeranylgeranylglycerophospholipid reductase